MTMDAIFVDQSTDTSGEALELMSAPAFCTSSMDIRSLNIFQRYVST